MQYVTWSFSLRLTMLYVFVCVCARMHVHVCVCVCLCVGSQSATCMAICLDNVHIPWPINICLTLSVGTSSMESSNSYSQMKIVKFPLRNRLGENSLSNLMKITIQSPQTSTDIKFRNDHKNMDYKSQKNYCIEYNQLFSYIRTLTTANFQLLAIYAYSQLYIQLANC